MLCLTWYKVINMSRLIRKDMILFLLVRDGTWTFLVVFCKLSSTHRRAMCNLLITGICLLLVTLALNGLFYLIIAGPLNSMAWSWQFVICSFGGCRLVLHMHTATAPSAATATLRLPSSRSDRHQFGSASEALPWGAARSDDTYLHDGYMLTTYVEETGAMHDDAGVVTINEENDIRAQSRRDSVTAGWPRTSLGR
jgi:hypothetical protein